MAANNTAATKAFLMQLFEQSGTPGDYRVMDGLLEKSYNLLNAATVLLGIRTGALLVRVAPDFFPTLEAFLGTKGIRAKRYFVGTNVLILGADASDELQEAFDSIQPFESTPNRNANQVKANARNRAVGQVLGYLTPIPLSTIRPQMADVGIFVTMTTPYGQVIRKIFPQRVFGPVSEFMDQLIAMEGRMREELQPLLPDGFTIDAVELTIEPPKVGGSRKRRVSKKRARKTKRKSR